MQSATVTSISTEKLFDQACPPVETMKSIDFEQYCDILEPAHITETLDLGGVIIHKALHPTLGKITLINTSGTTHGLLPE